VLILIVPPKSLPSFSEGNTLGPASILGLAKHGQQPALEVVKCAFQTGLALSARGRVGGRAQNIAIEDYSIIVEPARFL
jgi:hypothetical protein